MKKIGRYEVIEELGRGAMGVVYKASDPTIGRMVAIKVLTLDDKVEEGTLSPRDTFLREARAAGRLSHHGIVTIHDALEDESTRSSYIVMEYIPGSTLEKLLISSPQVDADRTFDIIRQVAEGLDYAHRNQIIHRDLKPANIILTEDGRAKITDFGIAKIAAQNAMRTMAIMGTPSYMSPEQVTGGEIDSRADIFSLGILLYLMLVGEKPFLGDTAAVMFKIVYEDPVAPSKVNSKLTAADDYVILRCLAKDRAKRYSSAREFLDDLDDLRRGRPPRSQARIAPSELHAADRTVAATHPLIPIRPPAAAMAGAAPSTMPDPPKVSAPAAPDPPAPAKPPSAPTAVGAAVASAAAAMPPVTPDEPGQNPSGIAAETKTAEKKSPTMIYVAAGLVALAVVGVWTWRSQGTGNATSQMAQPTVQVGEPARVTLPSPPDESASPDSALPASSPVVKNAPATSAKTLVKSPATANPQAAPPSAAAPAPSAAVAAAQPAPVALAAPSVSDITVYCKHEFEQATLVMTEGGKTLYQARLMGKKKKGFIGIGGKGFGGELRDITAIPTGAQELTVRVYSDDGSVNIQNKVAAHPPSPEATVLRVTPSRDQLKLDWINPK